MMVMNEMSLVVLMSLDEAATHPPALRRTKSRTSLLLPVNIRFMNHVTALQRTQSCTLLLPDIAVTYPRRDEPSRVLSFSSLLISDL